MFLKGILLEKTNLFSIFQFQICQNIFIKPYSLFLNFNDKSNFNKYFFDKFFLINNNLIIELKSFSENLILTIKKVNRISLKTFD